MSRAASDLVAGQTHRMSPDRLRYIGGMLMRWSWCPLVGSWEQSSGTTSSAEIAEVAQAISEEGDTGWDSWPPGVQINGYRYWVSLSYDNVIMRISLAPGFGIPTPYDAAAAVYDALYTSPEERAHEQSVMRLLWDSVGDLTDRSVLDIGCGTGLFLDYNEPGRYVGIDPSGEMLNCLVEKHPDRAADVVQAKLEEFVLPDDADPFDVVISLYASVSYADPAYVETIPSFARTDGGRWFVMTYDDGYEPLVHQYCDDPHARPGLPDGLPGERVLFPNYMIRSGQHGVVYR